MLAPGLEEAPRGSTGPRTDRGQGGAWSAGFSMPGPLGRDLPTGKSGIELGPGSRWPGGSTVPGYFQIDSDSSWMFMCFVLVFCS